MMLMALDILGVDPSGWAATVEELFQRLGVFVNTQSPTQELMGKS